MTEPRILVSETVHKAFLRAEAEADRMERDRPGGDPFLALGNTRKGWILSQALRAYHDECEAIPGPEISEETVDRMVEAFRRHPQAPGRWRLKFALMAAAYGLVEEFDPYEAANARYQGPMGKHLYSLRHLPPEQQVAALVRFGNEALKERDLDSAIEAPTAPAPPSATPDRPA